jgi:DNA-binding NarL/FixJ family response regulator
VQPRCATVAVSASHTHAEVLAAFRSGAVGYLGTDIEPPLLPDAIRGILANAAVLPAATLGWMMERLQDGEASNGNGNGNGAEGRGLTERHWQVLALVERRLSTAEIARELGVSPVTVRRHRSEIRTRSLHAPRAPDDLDDGADDGHRTPEP